MPEVGVSVTVSSSCTIVALSGDLDGCSAASCDARMRTALDGGTPGASVLALDLRDLTFCAVKGVRMLQAFAATCLQRGFTLRVVAPPGSITRRVLELLQVQNELHVVNEIEQAITSVR